MTLHQDYPATRTVDTVDDYHGTRVADPYRWLEDSDGDEAQAWLRVQGEITRAFLDGLPDREIVSSRLDALTSLPRRGVPAEHGGRYFRLDNDGSQQDVFVVADTPLGDGRVLLDPNPLTPDSTTSLADAVVSPDGTLVAYTWAEAGSDWRTWRVREVDSGTELSDEVPWAKFTPVAWLPNNAGFVYGGYDAPDGAAYTAANDGHTLRLHRLGTQATADEIVLELPDEPSVNFEIHTAEHGRWLVVTGATGTEWNSRVWVRDLAAPSSALDLVIAEASAAWTVVGALEDTLLMITDLDAPRGRLVALHPATGVITPLVPQSEHTLIDAVRCGDHLVLHRLADATSRLTLHGSDGTELGVIRTPERGSVTTLEVDGAVVHAGFTSFTRPPSVLRLDVADSADGRATATVVAGAPTTPDESRAPEVAGYVTEQAWISSGDGTRLPVFLVHRRDVTAANGPHPALLYGYGGFRIPVRPGFNAGRFVVVEAGGVLVVPSLRGGGEYGADWHEAGRLRNKQNVFDDAIATASWVIDEGWTDASHLAATGGSNGGLLAGTLLTQRPDLFAAVIPEVGVLDMLRFTEFTIGWAWASDYGDPRRSAQEFSDVLAYSPYHRVVDAVAYPPTLILTSDHDDRVVPAHSMKFAARLQASGAPLALLRVEPASGHGAGRARSAVVRERTDVLLFLARFTGLDVGSLANPEGFLPVA